MIRREKADMMGKQVAFMEGRGRVGPIHELLAPNESPKLDHLQFYDITSVKNR